jgi:1,4-dihydroxy-2-naphthoate octaprenyltransferase
MEKKKKKNTHQGFQPAQKAQAEPQSQSERAPDMVANEGVATSTIEPQAETESTIEGTLEAENHDAPVDEAKTVSGTAQVVDADVVVPDSAVVKQEPQVRRQPAAHIVAADSVEAEDIPTIPIGPLQSLKSLEPEIAVHSVASMRAVNTPVPLVVQPSEYRRGLGEWVDIWRDGLRLKYLPLSIMPVILGTVLAWVPTLTPQHLLGHLDIPHFIALLVTAILAQSGALLINDYYDYQRGVDTGNILGPGGLIQQGLIQPARILIVGLILLGIGAIIGLITALAGGPITCLFGLIIVLCAYFFSATKWSLSSIGLSELVGFVSFGLLPVLGSYMVQTHGFFDSRIVLYSFPLGFLAAATIYVNNLRDIEGDDNVGKFTLATMLGLRWSRVGYILLLLAAYLVTLLLGVPHGSPHFVLISLWTLPIMMVAISGVLRTEIAAGFNDIVGQTLKLLVNYTILLIIGLIISTLIPIIPHLPMHLFTIP